MRSRASGCRGKSGARLDLDHYLEALVRKPGTLPGSTALERAGRFALRGRQQQDKPRSTRRMRSADGQVEANVRRPPLTIACPALSSGSGA